MADTSTDEDNLFWSESTKALGASPLLTADRGACACGACGVRHCRVCGDVPQLAAKIGADGLCPTCRRTEKCAGCGRPTEPGEACCEAEAGAQS